MPATRYRVDKILKILRTTYPRVKTQLTHANPFQLLIATILSAQCTDKQVNAVTPALFERFGTPAALAGAPLREIERLVHSTGFFRNKARNIKLCSQSLVSDYGGNVPRDLELLVALPGVGRKTANVVLGAAFNIPGMVVDTHVARISRRLGLTENSDAVKVEFDLMGIIPRRSWIDFSLQLIYLGRDVCLARKPRCPVCPLRLDCAYPQKTNSGIVGSAASKRRR